MEKKETTYPKTTLCDTTYIPEYEEYKEYCEDPDYITDMLSDEFGFCVKSCSVEG